MNKKIVNLVDALLAIIILGVVLLGFFSFFKKDEAYSDQIKLTLRVTSDQVVENEARKQTEVFFNSVNMPVHLVKVERQGADLFITLKANGAVENGRFVFNGQRVLTGQKGEIHGSYFAQGIITDVKRED